MTDPAPADAGVSRPDRSRKSQLFCPACQYTAPVDGDWISEDATVARSLHCPACGAVVVRQPAVGAVVPL